MVLDFHRYFSSLSRGLASDSVFSVVSSKHNARYCHVKHKRSFLTFRSHLPLDLYARRLEQSAANSEGASTDSTSPYRCNYASEGPGIASGAAAHPVGYQLQMQFAGYDCFRASKSELCTIGMCSIPGGEQLRAVSKRYCDLGIKGR